MGTVKVAGPMWSGPLHDVGFVQKVIEHIGKNEDHYGTVTRMKGMLTVAKEVINLKHDLSRSLLMICLGTRHALLLYTESNCQFLPLRNTFAR